MKRLTLEPRKDWAEKADNIGFTYHCADRHTEETSPGVYWDESACYAFSAAEIDILEEATDDLHELCLKAVDRVCTDARLFERFRIPSAFQPLIVKSWKRSDPAIMGRFDLAFDPANPAIATPKLLEYNADTPTLVIETALMQWFWLQDRFPALDQFNSLHEKLIDAYRAAGQRMKKGAKLIISTLGPDESEEEFRHGQYFLHLAREAGLACEWIAVKKIRHSSKSGFLDNMNEPLRYWQKLYPWEWLIAEPYGKFLLDDQVGIIEPPWKMLLSNKAILTVLWDLFPGHQNLLAASMTPRSGPNVIAKPLLGREGANISLTLDGQTYSTTGTYDGARIYQDAVPLKRADGRHVVIGSWIAGGKPAGMILRESDADQPIVQSCSRVMPHVIGTPI